MIVLGGRAFRPRRRSRVALLAGVDAAAWVVAVLVATWLRLTLDGDVQETAFLGWSTVALTAFLAACLHVAVSLLRQSTRGHHTLGSIDEVAEIAAIGAGVAAVLFVLDLVTPGLLVPRSVPITAGLLAIALAAGARLLARRLIERAVRPDQTSASRVLILGAGTSGQQLIRSMLADSSSGYLPVGLLEDDPEMRRRRVQGIRVLGTSADIERVAEAVEASVLIVAARNIPGGDMQQVHARALAAGLAVKVLPPLSEMFRSWVGFSDLRDLDISDLLRRAPVQTDLHAVAAAVSGRRVLVTGAGGSIGSELCRQVHALGPSELLMLDRDESALHAVELSIHGRALLDSSDTILADIRDAAAITEIFSARRPEVVFHAAALKHLPMLERYPTEAWKTNVVGTQVVLDAAEACGVGKFVNISTDKAANPTSVLGRSKRLGERLVADAGARTGLPFLSVRFGNVLASRGSMLTVFAEQIASGGPVTVTHPDVTRFFMTIPEAVQLVIQASAVGRPGEALVLDMGHPVRILDVAHQLMEIAGQGVDIVFTGLREGEKLHEELFAPGEVDTRPAHPAISHVGVGRLSFADLEHRAALQGTDDAMRELAEPLGPMEGVAEMVRTRRAVAERATEDFGSAHRRATESVGPGSVGPGSVGPGSVGPESVGAAVGRRESW